MAWDANTILYIPCNAVTGTVLVDEVGGYNAEQIGTLTFDLTKKPNTWSKGMVAYATPVRNYFKTPLTLNTAMSSKAAFSIEFQLRLDAGYTTNFYTVFAKRFLADPTKRLMFDFTRSNSTFRAFFSNLSGTAFNYDTNNNGKSVHYSFEWTGSQIKIYQAGALKYTGNSQTVNSFSDTTNQISWLYEPDLGYGNVSGAWLSDIVISDVARGGVMTVPLPDYTGSKEFSIDKMAKARVYISKGTGGRIS